MMQRSLPLTLLLCLLVACLIRSVDSFIVLSKAQRSTRLYLLEDEQGWIGQPTIGDSAAECAGDSLHKALQERREQLKRGIGRRFVVRTQRGFLNVHSCMSKGPFATDNIVTQLSDGDVIVSKNIIGNWIQHEQGWSIARYEGFFFLKLLEE